MLIVIGVLLLAHVLDYLTAEVPDPISYADLREAQFKQDWAIVSRDAPLDIRLDIWLLQRRPRDEFEERDVPLFDPETGQWTTDGKPVSNIYEFMTGWEVEPDGSNPIMIVDLPDSATFGDYRAAIVSLADKGICRVGVRYPPADPVYWNDDGSVDVYEIKKASREGHFSGRCRDRFPPWSP